MDWSCVPPGDPKIVNKVVEEYMSQGKFDHIRRQLLADVDTKSSYQNLKQRMEGAIRTYLASQTWRSDLNRNQLRDSLKRHLLTAPFLQTGVSRVVEQVVSPSVVKDMRPDLEKIARSVLGIENEPEESTAMVIEPIDSPEDFRNNQQTENNEGGGDKSKEFEELMVPGEEPVSIKRSLPTEAETSTSNEPEAFSSNQPETMEETVALPDNSEDMQIDMSDDDSVHSITNQMSPISFGSPSPPPKPPTPPPTPAGQSAIKRASDFVGKIPKIKKDTSADNIKDKGGTNNVDDQGKKDDSRLKNDRKRSDDKHHSRSDRDKDKSRKSSSSSSSRDKDKDRRRDSHSSRDKNSTKSSSKTDEKNKDKSSDREKTRTSSSSSSRDKSREQKSDKDRSSHRDGKSGDRSKDRHEHKDNSSSKRGEESKERDKSKDSHKSSHHSDNHHSSKSSKRDSSKDHKNHKTSHSTQEKSSSSSGHNDKEKSSSRSKSSSSSSRSKNDTSSKENNSSSNRSSRR